MKSLKLLFYLSLFFTSCTSVKIASDYDRSIDFSHYKTYAWIQRSDSVNRYWYDNEIIEKNVVLYTSNELKARGYSLDLKNPDLLVEYHSVVKKEHYTVSNPIYSNITYSYNPFGYNPFRPYGYYNAPYIIGYQQSLVEYNEGTLLIDIIDRKTNQLIWRGWSTSTIDDEEDLENQLGKDIHKIMQKFPVQPLQTAQKK